MRRRTFLGTPIAGAAFGVGVFGNQAIASTSLVSGNTTSGNLSPVLLRLQGSTGRATDVRLLDNAWQGRWSVGSRQVLQRGRLTLHGMVRAPGSSSQINVEAAYFGDGNALNTSLVYIGANDSFGACSKGVGMDVEAATFGGFSLGTPDMTGTRSVGSCAIGTSSGLIAGLYVMMLPAIGSESSVYAGDYLFSTYLDRPLMRKDGVLPKVDYLAFSIADKR